MVDPMQIAIGFDSDEWADRARAIARDYHFVLDHHALPRLQVTADQLELLIDGFAPLFVHFNGQVLQRRRDAGKQQGLIRACKPAPGVHIVDATAGWGRDAAVLAGFGADVLMLERHPVVAALLLDALQRLRLDEVNALSLNLVHIDAQGYLEHLVEDDYPDVIYMDPMHPERKKSALVKKDMQALQRLMGPDHDDDVRELIQFAMTRARQRVVVKWPQRLPALLKPSHSVAGKTVRFDVYCASRSLTKR